MKKFGLFIGGFISGVITIILIIVIIGVVNSSSNSGIKIFEKTGDCVAYDSIKVFQTLEDGMALTSAKSEYGMYTGMTMLITNNKGKTYYDEEIIKTKKCFRQIGTYQYETKSKIWKTVPVVIAE